MTAIRKASCVAIASIALLGVAGGSSPAHAADIMADWSSVTLPPPPELKPVTLDGKTTAFLMLDFMKDNCGVRPRCAEMIPKVKAMMDRARAAGALIAYTMPGNGEVIDHSIAPHDG